MRSDPYFALGPVTHGLTLLGARDLAEVRRIGMDVVYSDHLRDTGGEPIVDVHHGRVVFPSPPEAPRQLPAPELDWDYVRLANGQPALPAAAAARNSRAIPPDEWPTEFAVILARFRHDGLIDVRRLANEARARLGLLSADDEDNIIAAGGTVYGAQAWRHGNLAPIAAGAAAEPAVRALVARRQARHGR